MNRWTDTRVITGWSLLALVFTTVICTAIWAGDRAGQRHHEEDIKEITACIVTTRTAAECRVLVYGSR